MQDDIHRLPGSRKGRGEGQLQRRQQLRWLLRGVGQQAHLDAGVLQAGEEIWRELERHLQQSLGTLTQHASMLLGGKQHKNAHTQLLRESSSF